ncbi:PAAR domain-containing protein [Sorangium sp. So ce327]
MPAHQPKAGKPAAKQGDKVAGIDTHVVMIRSPGGPVPTPTPLAFSGTLSGDLSRDVLIEGKAAAIQGSTAANAPAHVPPGSTFQRPPSNQARVRAGSKTVLINNKPAARLGDPAMTCDDLADAPNGSAIAAGRVLVAGRDPALLVGKELVVERVNADRPNVGDIHVDKESAVLRRKRPAIEEAENVERRQRFEPFAGRRVAWHDEEQLDRSGLVSTRRPHGRRAHLRGPRRARLSATLGAAPAAPAAPAEPATVAESDISRDEDLLHAFDEGAREG